MKENELNEAEIEDLVLISKSQAVTTSKKISELFKKRHSDVIRAIKNLNCSDDFRERNFALMVKKNELPQGGATESQIYYITRDGFTFLAMGFTGREAAKFKEAYIKAFNLMEDIIRHNNYVELAARMLTSNIQDFNAKMLSASTSAGCTRLMQTGIIDSDKLELDVRIRNIFAQLNNFYLDAINTQVEKQNLERKLENIQNIFSDMTRKMQSIKAIR